MTIQANSITSVNASLTSAGHMTSSSIYINQPYNAPYPYTSPLTTPYTAPLSNPYTIPGTISQPIITFPTTGNGGIYYPGGNVTIGSQNQVTKYHVMISPAKRIPNLIYVCGRLITFGALGTDAECAYAGNGKLIFVSSTLNSIIFSNKRTISLQYKTKVYHYVIENYRSNDILLNCKLLSEVSFK